MCHRERSVAISTPVISPKIVLARSPRLFAPPLGGAPPGAAKTMFHPKYGGTLCHRERSVAVSTFDVSPTGSAQRKRLLAKRARVE